MDRDWSTPTATHHAIFSLAGDLLRLETQIHGAWPFIRLYSPPYTETVPFWYYGQRSGYPGYPACLYQNTNVGTIPQEFYPQSTIPLSISMDVQTQHLDANNNPFYSGHWYRNDGYYSSGAIQSFQKGNISEEQIGADHFRYVTEETNTFDQSGHSIGFESWV